MIHIQIGFGFIALVFLVKLLNIQVFSSNYKLEAEDNIRTRIVEYPLRGMIYDRNGKLLVGNQPVFDLLIIPRELEIPDSLAFCEFFNIDMEYLRTQIQKARKYSPVKPSLFIKQLKAEEYARIQDRLTEMPGIITVPKTVRYYPHQSMANILGYVKEVDPNFLAADTTGYYKMRDQIGISGIERYYEAYLRGQRGVSYKMINVRGVVQGAYRNGEFDTLPTTGQTLMSSIDLELQQYAERLMQNKRGAVVAIEPSTGEVLVMLSAPSYNPSLLTGEGADVTDNYNYLVNHPDKPLFNRAIMSSYPPGSTFKTIMALVGLHQGVIDTTSTSYSCSREFFNCHAHPSPTNVYNSIRHSCNPFYRKAFKRIVVHNEKISEFEETRTGLTELKRHLETFGLGNPPEVDLPFAKGGLIPSVAYYDRWIGERQWKASSIHSISIGQGEIGVTPIQLANVAAIIANKGWYIAPHLIKQVGDTVGLLPAYQQKHHTEIAPIYFDHIGRAMSQITTAALARIPGINICGKTGTAQNPHGKDHSVYMAFAPYENPKIAIAVYVENAGFGGSWAGPIASLITEKYLTGNIQDSRKWVEQRMLDANFMEEPNM